MKRKLSFTTVLLCSLVICWGAVFADLTGKWKGTVVAPDGEEVVLTYNIKVDGSKLTGTGESQGVTANIYEASFTGNDFKFKVINSGGVVIPHTGKYYPQGDSVGVDVDYNGIKFHATLKRDK